jgi:arylsulfatase A-like enzyme
VGDPLEGISPQVGVRTRVLGLLRAGWIPCFVGMVWGALEACGHLLSGDHRAPRAFILYSLFHYGVIGMLAGMPCRVWPRWRCGITGSLRKWLPGIVPLGFLCVLFALFARSANRSQVKAQTGDLEGKPNILLLLVDALRADHVSCYGYSRETTPALDRFAEESLLFDKVSAQSPWTMPSMASLLTSLYPPTHGCLDRTHALPCETPYLPEILSAHGYDTLLVSANPYISPLFGYDRGVDHVWATSRRDEFEVLWIYHLLSRVGHWAMTTDRPILEWTGSSVVRLVQGVSRLGLEWSRHPGRTEILKNSSAAGINRAFLDWLDGTKPERFYAHLHYMETHTPYTCPEPFFSMYAQGSTAIPTLGWDSPQHPPVIPQDSFFPVARQRPPSPEQRLDMLARYDGCLRFWDFQFEALWGEMKRRGLIDNTLIIVMSDHGEMFGEHGLYGHDHALTESLLHVPMVIRFPGQERRGQRVSRPVRSVDLLPTILEHLDLDLDLSFQGAALRSPFSADDTDTLPCLAYAEKQHGNFSASWLSGNWKIIQTEGPECHEIRLYELTGDPGEQTDLSQVQAQRSEQMLSVLRSEVADLKKHRLGEIKVIDLPGEVRDQLRSLGYVGR